MHECFDCRLETEYDVSNVVHGSGHAKLNTCLSWKIFMKVGVAFGMPACYCMDNDQRLEQNRIDDPCEEAYGRKRSDA